MNSQTSSPKSLDQRTLEIQRTLRENFHREITLSELAKSVNLSVWRLCHVFRSDLGMSPIKYLKLLRMERARHLLETSFLSVKQISFRVGINDESHFVRDFKKAYGKAPTQYRSRMNDQSNASDQSESRTTAPAEFAGKSFAILLPAVILISYTVSYVGSTWS